MTTAFPYVLLAPGREVILKGLWAKWNGFTRGRIVACISTVEKAVTEGGYYRIERLDGPEHNRDLFCELHRSAFVPVGKSKLARLVRLKAEKEVARG